MKPVPQPVQTFFKWVSRILGVLILLPLLVFFILLVIFAVFAVKERAVLTSWGVLPSICVGSFVMALLGFWLVRLGWRKEKNIPPPLPTWFTWLCWLGGSLIVCLQAVLVFFVSLRIAEVGAQLIHEKAPKDAGGLFFLVALSYGPLVANLIWLLIGIVIARWPGMRLRKNQAQQNPPVEPVAAPEPLKITSYTPKNRHWSSCNILHTAADAHRLWQFGAKGGNFVLDREHNATPGEPLPPRFVAKSWNSLWSPRLNVAWLPPESVFLRVLELPKSSFEETQAMVELQLEKLSPLPVAQIVWTLHLLPAAGDLQTVVVIIAGRAAVEEFLGKLEKSGYLADRLEAPMLDLLEAAPATEDGAWIYVGARGKDAALVAWRSRGALRNLCLIALPSEGDRAKSLKDQLAQLCWAGEMEGWLTEPPQWHLVADPVNAADWERLFREALNEPVRVAEPPPPAELAARTARRAAASPPGAALLPAEFSARYHQQFVDHLWLRGLVTTGILYAIGVVIYFCATYFLSLQTVKVEQQAAQLGDSYTNVLELQARYKVLQQREQLKYAALDCWKIVAEDLPAGLTLQRSSFADGQQLTLSGVCAQDQINEILGPGKFYDAVHKAKRDGQDVFDPTPVEPLVINQSGDRVTWHFALRLKHTEGGQ
jgi:hypothetical protein